MLREVARKRIGAAHRRRINTEEKAEVVAAVRGGRIYSTLCRAIAI